MKNIFILAVAFSLLVGVSGCETAPMTAHSKLDVAGPATVVERTTTITVGANGATTTNVVETSSVKSPAAGDLEIKSKELSARRDVGVAKASGSGSAWTRFWAPTYPVYYPYYSEGTSSTPLGGYVVTGY